MESSRAPAGAGLVLPYRHLPLEGPAPGIAISMNLGKKMAHLGVVHKITPILQKENLRTKPLGDGVSSLYLHEIRRLGKKESERWELGGPKSQRPHEEFLGTGSLPGLFSCKTQGALASGSIPSPLAIATVGN